MKIVLLGYMGSGKSSIGKLLATKLAIDFVDLDKLIEQKERMTINEIFTKRGEVYFRKREHLYLCEVLSNNQDLIIAVGGGTPCYGNNIEIINNASFSVYLKASIETIVNRLKSEKYKRPLIAHLKDEDLPEFIGKHLFERIPFYVQSNIEIKTDCLSFEEITDTLIAQIKTNLNKP